MCGGGGGGGGEGGDEGRGERVDVGGGEGDEDRVDWVRLEECHHSYKHCTTAECMYSCSTPSHIQTLGETVI